MLIHRLIWHHLKHQDDMSFYVMQAQHAMAWLERAGVRLNAESAILDLGCGHGVFGAEYVKKGCRRVVFADEVNTLMPGVPKGSFRQFNIDRDDLAGLGTYDLVICSNVFEHLSKPTLFLRQAPGMLNPDGKLFLSWTNWLSPWGGHEFSPFHYLGPRLGTRIYDRIVKKPRLHTPYQNLFPTYIGETLSKIRASPHLRLVKMAPRYYTELSFLMYFPVLREYLAWNCALLLARK